MATAVAQLKALMGIDAAQAEKAVDNIGNKVKNLGSNQLAGLKGMIAGAFSAGALIAFGRNLLKISDDLVTTANMVGITTESMVALKTITAESGLSTENLFKSLGRLKDSQGEVVTGNKMLIDALKQLNISEEEFVGLKVDDLLELLAKKYHEAGGSAEAFNGIVGIFGKREGLAMIEVLERINKEGLAELKEKSKEAAIGVEKLAAASDLLEATGNKFIIFGAKAVAALTKVGGAIHSVVYGLWTTEKAGSRLGLIAELAKAGWKAESKPPATPSATTTGIPTMSAIKSVQDMARASDLNALAKRKQLEADKEAEAWWKKEEAHREKVINLMEQQDKLAEDYEEKQKDILAGKGISGIEQARVDQLQRIGGIIGGIAGAGSQEARIAEATRKATEDIVKLQQETNRRLQDIENKIFELGEG